MFESRLATVAVLAGVTSLASIAPASALGPRVRIYTKIHIRDDR